MTVRVECSHWTAELTLGRGDRLIDALDDRPQTWTVFACRGAHCGTCRVRVVEGAGALLPAAADELETLRATNSRSNERLACQLRIGRDDGTVRLEVSPASSPTR